jgi:hypothetical protein
VLAYNLTRVITSWALADHSAQIAFHDDTLMAVVQRLHVVLEDAVLDRQRPDNLELSERRQAQIALYELDLSAGGKFMRRHRDRLLIQGILVEARVRPIAAREK